ncbi:hypothetical protein RFI_17987 [Reticulomyxa filosa]|uniref:Uncharacterized protein n=1 Tax=Reticulomyxa filosa TaxID=46433 RepID=X6N012_RETFI|nr:hypothetical protein RFI_17987 [Reticulomyxa filosa]|eukprot:ETO19243.1 hypothetical protein RFI_17987 [Reticulomyxa filosa]
MIQVKIRKSQTIQKKNKKKRIDVGNVKRRYHWQGDSIANVVRFLFVCLSDLKLSFFFNCLKKKKWILILQIGYVFCSAHRFPDAHACAFDYKEAQKKKLDALNPVVAPSKVDKI